MERCPRKGRSVNIVKVGDKLTFNYVAHFPTKVGTVRSIVPSSYSKGGAFADVIIGKR